MFSQIQAGKLDRSLLAPALDGELTDAMLATMANATAPLGKPDGFILRYSNDIDGATTYVYRLHWSTGALDYTFGVDDATDKIRTLYLRPGPPA